MSWGGGKVIVNTDKREMEESRRERESKRGKDIVVIQEKVLFRMKSESIA